MKNLRTILKEKGINQKIVADALGVDVTSIRRYDDLSKRSVEEILTISKATGIPFEELTGEKVVNKLFNLIEKDTGSILKSRPQRTIKYWTDVDVTGGGVELFEDTLTNNYEDMVIPEFRDCTDAVNLYGDSMSPRYNPGQIVILKEWTDSFIAYGQVYLVITKSGFRTVKYLRKGKNATEVLCVSENPNYDPFPIELDNIVKMYLVKGVIEKTAL